MSKRIVQDLTNMKFGRWTVISRAENLGTRVQWLCRCDCGTERVVRADCLRRRQSESCGCLAKERSWIAHKMYNDYIIDGDVTKVITNQQDVILIDTSDIDKVKPYYWYVDDRGYARTALAKGSHIRMHQLILPNRDGLSVDHISGNTLDNRKCNLRLCTQAENSCNCRLRKDNTSGYKGVIKRISKTGKIKYAAYIGYNYKHIYLGEYVSLDDAVFARKQAEIKYFGEYSREYAK